MTALEKTAKILYETGGKNGIIRSLSEVSGVKVKF